MILTIHGYINTTITDRTKIITSLLAHTMHGSFIKHEIKESHNPHAQSSVILTIMYREYGFHRMSLETTRE